MAVARIVFFALFARAAAAAADLDSSDLMAANPIRKVVNMLQNLQKKVTSEGEQEAALYAKFQCYCSNSGSTLGQSISDAEVKVSSVGSDIKSGEAKLKQDKEDLKRAKADREEAKSSMAQATSLRDKEAAAFAAEHAESTANIAALTGAIASIEKGVSGFLQTEGAQRVRRAALSDKDLADFDRDVVISFLSGAHGTEYVPQSGQIVGILKDINDRMSKSLADAKATEASAIASYDELMNAKTKEVNALSETIETKNVRVGSLSVEVVEMKGDLADTQESLLQDKQFKTNMVSDCATKASEYDTNVKTRSDELLAIAETIKLLSDDDALDLFKRTLPSQSSSLLQMQEGLAARRARALQNIVEAQQRSSQSAPGLDLIALALQGGNINFGKVVKMIDGMVATLKQEQSDDNSKQTFCTKQLDSAADKKKGLERKASDLDSTISKEQDALATLNEEIKTIEDGLKSLDKEVADATEQRKMENKEYTDLMASNTAAKELLGMAMSRMKKFYDPTGSKVVKTGDQSSSLAQIQQHQHDAPPSPPKSGAYAKNKDESGGVLEMIRLLVKDIEKEMTETQTTEKDSQSDYERATKNAADKRALDSKTLTNKRSAKARVETELLDSQGERGSAAQELMTTDKFMISLHAECDFLLQYFDVRKEARDGEISSLQNAKSVLLGADLSLVQQGRRLRGLA